MGRCGICTDQGIRLLGLMKIDLFKEREFFKIGWNMENSVQLCRNETHIGTLCLTIFIKLPSS